VRLTCVPLVALCAGCVAAQPEPEEPLGKLPTAKTTAEPLWMPFRITGGKDASADPRERHFTELRQLTFDGSAGAAAFTPDGQALLFESGRGAQSCGTVHRYDLRTGKIERLGPDGGASSTGVATADGTVLLTRSEKAEPPCTSLVELRFAAVESDIVAIGAGGTPKPLAPAAGWDGELSLSSDGRRVVFTSTRDGDADVYSMATDGTALLRISHAGGYDGAPLLSPDGARIAWHTERERAESPGGGGRALAPRLLRIVVAGAEGQHPTHLPALGRYDMTPAWLPDSRRLLIASDLDDAPSAEARVAAAAPPPAQPPPAPPAAPAGTAAATAVPVPPPPPPPPPAPPPPEASPPRNFELYLVDPDAPPPASGGIRFERITYDAAFDAAPRFSPDGRWLVFLSTRNAQKPGDVNLFAARWTE
jgi:TolB protein